MDLIPTQRGNKLYLTCKYTNSDWYHIVFKEGNVTFSTNYVTNILTNYNKTSKLISRRRELQLIMEGFARNITCVVLNQDTGLEHGSMIYLLRSGNKSKIYESVPLPL